MTAAEFKLQFLPHHKVLYRVAYHLTGNPADAEDLLQDLYLKLWQHRDDWSVPEAETQPYLMTMLRRMRIDQLRRKHLATVDVAAEDVRSVSPADVEAEITNRDELQHIAGLITQLPGREQRLVEMHIFDDLSYQQIQLDTGLSPGNIRITMMRARQKLKVQLKKITRS